jgi:SagB-type dehydrogenase family enzyme
MTDAAGEIVPLPQPRLTGSVSIEETLARRRSVRAFSDAALGLEAVGQLLWAAQGTTHAEVQRTAPSAGALYPLEIYLVAGNIAALPAAIYYYAPQRHQLVRIAVGDRRRELGEIALRQHWIGEAPAIVVISAVLPRTSAKYGDWGQRYVHIEAGHAAENVCLQAVALGLGTTVVGAFSDRDVRRLLARSEEDPLLLIPLGKPG